MSCIFGYDMGWDVFEKKWFLKDKNNNPQFFLKLEDMLTEIGKRLEKMRIDQEFNFKYMENRSLYR